MNDSTPRPSRARLSMPALVALLRAPNTRTRAHEEVPTDCVRQFPVIGSDAVQLVGFDADGTARIKIELPADEPLDQWAKGMARWVRRKYGKPLSLMR